MNFHGNSGINNNEYHFNNEYRNDNSNHSVNNFTIVWLLCLQYLSVLNLVQLNRLSKQFQYFLHNNQFLWLYSVLKPKNHYEIHQILLTANNNNSIQPIAKNLKYLSKLDLSLVSEYFNDVMTNSNNNNSTKLSVLTSLNKLLSVSPNLTSFNFSSCYLPDDMSYSVTISNLNYNIKSLTLSECTAVSGNTLKSISTKLINLQSLNLSFCDNLQDLDLLFLIKNKYLSNLDISYCNNLSDNALFIIRFFPNLVNLNIDWCNNISDNGMNYLVNKSLINVNQIKQFINVLAKQYYANKTKSSNNPISVNDITTLGLLLLNAVTDNNKNSNNHELTFDSNLHNISCRGCSIGNNGVHSLSHLYHLNTINIRECNNINELGLNSLIQLKTINCLDISDCKINNHSDNPLSFLNGLNTLTSLIAYNIEYLSDKSLFSICSLTKLKILKLSSASFISNNGLKYINELIIKYNHLQVLDLIECINITDIGLEYLTNNIPSSCSLNELNISRCYNLTDKGLYSICKGFPNITFLNISNCNLITDYGLMNNVCRLGKLQNLELKCLKKLTVNSIKSLIQNSKNLKYLDCRYCSRSLQRSVISSQKFNNLYLDIDVDDEIMSELSEELTSTTGNHNNINNNNHMNTNTLFLNDNHYHNEYMTSTTEEDEVDNIHSNYDYNHLTQFSSSVNSPNTNNHIHNHINMTNNSDTDYSMNIEYSEVSNNNKTNNPGHNHATNIQNNNQNIINNSSYSVTSINNSDSNSMTNYRYSSQSINFSSSTRNNHSNNINNDNNNMNTDNDRKMSTNQQDKTMPMDNKMNINPNTNPGNHNRNPLSHNFNNSNSVQ